MTTFAIIVLYNDNTQEAEDNIRNLSKQVDRVCVIDNSSEAYNNRFGRMDAVIYLPQYKNIGIAAAQNIGIRYAIKEKADFLLFADPDSNIPDEAVENLHKVYIAIQSQGIKVSSIGSVAYDAYSGKRLPLTANLIGEKKLPGLDDKIIEVGYVMNSISLIPVTMMNQCGLMDEDLFIDGVDSEWCWRANRKSGSRCFLYEGVRISHHLGEGDRNVGYRKISIGSPFRLYYQFRNFILLIHRDYVPHKWLWYNGFKYIIKMFYYPIMIKPRKKNLEYIIKGIKAGITHKRNQ